MRIWLSVRTAGLTEKDPGFMSIVFGISGSVDYINVTSKSNRLPWHQVVYASAILYITGNGLWCNNEELIPALPCC